MQGITHPDTPPVIHKYSRDGEILKTLQPPQCGHALTSDGKSGQFIQTISIQGVPYLAVSCCMCHSIQLFNISNDAREGTIITACKGMREEPAFYNMCEGPKDTLLAVSLTGQSDRPGALIVFDCSSTSFTVKDTIPIKNKSVVFINYLEAGYTGGLVIASFWQENVICGTSLRDKQLVWRLHGEVMGKTITPRGMCIDDRGRLYAADGRNKRILVLDGSAGHVLQVVELPELGAIVEIAWCNTQPHLIVWHGRAEGKLTITCYNVT